MKKLGVIVALKAVAVLAMTVCGAPSGMARAACGGFTLVCENGRSYPLCPLAVSDAGEVVTARLMLSPQHGAHVRLVPMGVGYRYITRGVWVDGVDGEAVLNFGKNRSVACNVVSN